MYICVQDRAKESVEAGSSVPTGDWRALLNSHHRTRRSLVSFEQQTGRTLSESTAKTKIKTKQKSDTETRDDTEFDYILLVVFVDVISAATRYAGLEL